MATSTTPQLYTAGFIPKTPPQAGTLTAQEVAGGSRRSNPVGSACSDRMAWQSRWTSGQAENLRRLGGAPGRFESLKQRSDFGDVTGRLARKSIAANVSFFVCLHWQTQRIVYQPRCK